LLRNVLQYKLFGSGPIASNGAETQAFVHIGNCAEPNLQIYGLALAMAGADGPAKQPGFSLLANLVRPFSKGRVRLASADPLAPPNVEPNFLSDPRDLSTMVQAIRYLRRIMKSSPLTEIMGVELLPGEDVKDEDEQGLASYVKRTVETNYHPVGTCRIGAEHDRLAVLTPDLKVKGVEGLRVLDASMMPSIIGANTNATVMAVAWKGVDLIFGKRLDGAETELCQSSGFERPAKDAKIA
jgi:choline dehydrogenase-like flavoprotein